MFKNELGQISFGQFGPCRASTVYNLNAKKVNDLPRYSVLVKYIVVGTHMHTSRTLTFLYEKKKYIVLSNSIDNRSFVYSEKRTRILLLSLRIQEELKRHVYVLLSRRWEGVDAAICV